MNRTERGQPCPRILISLRKPRGQGCPRSVRFMQRSKQFMKRHLVISTDPIDEAALVRDRSISADLGAVVYFAGVVRGAEESRAISAIDYEVFQRMAEHQFHLLFDQIEKRWPVASVRLVHRIGNVKVSEPSLWVEVTAPHRGEAFAACQFLIDEMKRFVPIWKKPQLV